MNSSKSKALALCAVSAALAVSCGKRNGKGTPDAGRRNVVFAPGATEHRVDTSTSTVSLSVMGGIDPGSTVSAGLTLRGGALSLSNASVPAARFFVDLTSFDSHLPIRNERVKQVFFETTGGGGESAEIVVQRLPEDALAKLRARKLVAGSKTEADLVIHGRTSKITLSIEAGYNERGALWVKTSTPVLVNIADLGMSENKKKLMATCLHDRIDDVVKIEASLEFTPQ